MIPINEIVDFVHTTLGGLTRETFVSRAIAAEFQARGFCVEREACIPVWFESSNGIKHRLGVLQADLIVTDELHPSEQHIIEFKVTPDTDYNRQNAIDQIKNYIRCSKSSFKSAWVVFYPKQSAPTVYNVDYSQV